MKTLRNQIVIGEFLLGMSLVAAPVWGQRLCPALTIANPPTWPNPCPITYEFVRPVDLDGDGVAEFTHERYFASNHFDFYDPSTGQKSGYAYQDDTIEAYYPAGQVEMYWLIWGPTFGDPEPRVPAGHELLPEPVVPVREPGTNPTQRYGSWGLPEPARSWVYPHFEAQGLGIIYRQLQYTCEAVVPICGRNYYGGYLAPWEQVPATVVRQDYDQYFGFRVRRADGWHLGWLQLRWQYERGGLRPDPVALVAWAVHPEPDAAIVVGEPARPKLQCERGADGGLVVKWSAVWTNAVLERSPSLSAPAWVAVSGVQPQGVRLSASEAQGFFRLRVP